MSRFSFDNGRQRLRGDRPTGGLPDDSLEFVPRGTGSAPVVITGGAGFIGCNLADRLLSAGQRVLIFDNLSRAGVESNLEWLINRYGAMVSVEIGDVRNSASLNWALERARAVFHFAAQVAVTSSLVSPRHDFEVNLRGTINLLEIVRRMENPPPLIFTSTNKVYGGLDQIALLERERRYVPQEIGPGGEGICEDQQLDFHSPYGCSKGAADQYVLDYARSFGLPAVVFRMSCIYGPHQFGNEDQGWLAHFLIRALRNEPVTLYGNGKQVRDVLFVDDLLDAFLLAWANIEDLAGNAFNIGGGCENTLSLLEAMELVRQVLEIRPQICWGDWRVGDQRYYVSDYGKFHAATGWAPRVGIEAGVKQLICWLQSADAHSLVSEVL